MNLRFVMHNLCQKKLTLKLTNMKSRKLLWAVVLLLSQSSQAAELSSFDEERSKYLSYKDPTRLSYLYNRCAALQLNVAALLSRKKQAQGAKDFEALAQHYMVLSEANEREIDKKRGLKSKDTMKTVHRSVSNVAETYTKRMKSNFAKRGDYIVGDPQLESELAECNLPNEFKKKALAN
jgi:hypothetical protein